MIFKNYFFLPVEIFMLYILSLSANMSILNASSLCLKTIYSFLNISFKCLGKIKSNNNAAYKNRVAQECIIHNEHENLFFQKNWSDKIIHC